MPDVVIRLRIGKQIIRMALPSDVPIDDLLNELLSKFRLPTREKDGSPINYQVRHVKSGNILTKDATLGEEGISKDDTDDTFELVIKTPRINVTEGVREGQTRQTTLTRNKTYVQEGGNDSPDILFNIGFFLVYCIAGGLLGSLAVRLVTGGNILIGSIIGFIIGLIIWFIREIY
ncbi:hypothetical protein JW879_05595 [candidate division WOR-3 bacterium]|nr:hypothetical protein [candidate division WOR-3 bacterium]